MPRRTGDDLNRSISRASPGRVTPLVLATPQEIGSYVAAMIRAGIHEATADGRPYVLGCPSGRSPSPVYHALAREVAAHELDLRALTIVMMDEYVEQDPDSGELRRVDSGLSHSCVGFGLRNIVGPLDAAAGAGRGVAADGLWSPDPADPAAYDEKIRRAGGVDLFLLASGASDGHVAFNPPGSSYDSRTRIVELADSTRRDNLSTFPTFGALEDVPRVGVTVGIETIRESSRRVVMIAHGADKAEAVRKMARAQRYEASWPATILAECREPSFVVDRQAADRARFG
jgi:glucosamine-6-phosphate deaminase